MVNEVKRLCSSYWSSTMDLVDNAFAAQKNRWKTKTYL